MTATVAPTPGDLGAAAGRDRADRDRHDGPGRLRQLPVDDRGARSSSTITVDRGGPAGLRQRSVGDDVHLPHARLRRRPAAPRLQRDRRRLHRHRPGRGDRHVRDGQPRPAGAGRSTSRSRPTASTPTRRPGRSSRSARPVTWTYLVTNTGNVPLTEHRRHRRPGRGGRPAPHHARARAATRPARPPAPASRASTRTSARSPRPAPVGTRRSPTRSVALLRRRRRGSTSRRRPTARRRPAAGPVHPGRRPGHLDLRRHQHRQRAAHRRRPSPTTQRRRRVSRRRSTRWQPASAMTCTAPAAPPSPGSTRTSARSTGTSPTASGRRTPTRRTTSARRPPSTSRSSPTATTPTRRPARSIAVGDPVDWTYVVTNTGNVPLTAGRVDRRPGRRPWRARASCSSSRAQSITCFASGHGRAPGQYANIGTVDAAPARSGTAGHRQRSRRTTSASQGAIEHREAHQRRGRRRGARAVRSRSAARSPGPTGSPTPATSR